MFIRLDRRAALFISAAFMYSSVGFAQAPIVDASMESYTTPLERNNEETARPSPPNTLGGSGNNVQGELFYQLQLLQQEVMQLRGAVEEQAYLLKQMKTQNMERYIDLDRRVGELATNPTAPTPSSAVSALSTSTAQSGEKPRYDAAYKLVVNKQFDQALDTFKQFLVDFPEGKYAPNSLYWIGELYQVISPQDLEASRQAFTQLLDQYPDHTKAPDAMYKLGKVYYQKGNKEKSRQWMERVIAKYGDGVSAASGKASQFLSTKF